MTYKIAQWHKGTFSALDLEENEKNLVLPAERERGREGGETFLATKIGGGIEEPRGTGEPRGGTEDDGAAS
jgi:hypothetical protein